jgi:hypothetical protein
VDPAWLEDELADLERLVAERDTTGVFAKLQAMFDAPRHAGSRAREMV